MTHATRGGRSLATRSSSVVAGGDPFLHPRLVDQQGPETTL